MNSMPEGDLHYLDDFILVAKDQQSATLQKDLLVTSLQSIRVPIEQSKSEGPAKPDLHRN